MNRRGFLRFGLGAAAAIAAPALVSRANIMAIKVPRPDPAAFYIEITEAKVREAQRRVAEIMCMEIGEIDRFTVYVDPAIGPDRMAIVQRLGHEVFEVADVSASGREGREVFEVVNLTASNYGRGPGLLTEDALGVRRWTPAPTALEIEARRAEAWRSMRQWLEPRGSRRWV